MSNRARQANSGRAQFDDPGGTGNDANFLTIYASPGKITGVRNHAEIAQLVEHTTENCGVRSPILRLGTRGCSNLCWTAPLFFSGRRLDGGKIAVTITLMRRKNALLLAAGALALLAGYLWRPIHIADNGKVITLHAAALTTGQALYAAGVRLDPADTVTPRLDQPAPLNGQITIRRAVLATLWADGQLRQISGPERDPAALLAAAGITLAPADRLLLDGKPLSAGDQLPTGRPIVLQLRRARTFVLDNQGRRQKYASTAPTVAGALWDAGVRLSPSDALSVPAGQPLDNNMLIAYRPARALTIQAGGLTIPSRSTAATIGEALAEAGVSLQGLDFTRPAEDQPLPQDGKIQVVRVSEDITLTTTLLPYTRKTAPDPNLELDTRQVTRPGQYGVTVQRERARSEDGQVVSRVVDSDWQANAPVDELVGIGTKVVPKKLETPDGTIEYWRAINVYATSYSPCNLGTGDCGYSTSSGLRLTKGIIAVTPAWYHIIGGLRVYVPGYGAGVIADVGHGIPGTPWIDLGYDDAGFAAEGHTGWTTLYFLTPAPANVSWSLP